MSDVAARPRLLIIAGPPAAGKTTTATRLGDRHDAIVLTPDDWLAELRDDPADALMRDRVEALQWRLAQTLLTRGVSVVLDWGAFTRDKRDALRTGARALGAAVELHYLDAPREVLWERIRDRARDGDERAIGREQFESILTDLEPPDAAEWACFDTPWVSANATG